MKTILISAGDLSGEGHAAELVHALRERIPNARFVGMGGAAMAAAGVELSVDQRQLAIGGIFEVLGSLPRIVQAWRGMLRCLRETRPDLVVLIDSGGFNLPFARRVRALSHAKILYYVAPQVWAWRPKRLQRLAERTDRIAVTLPFEVEFYAERGVSAEYVGHPVLDRIGTEAPGERLGQTKAGRASLRIEGLSDRTPLLGIFPGSRRNELERHLPIQLASFARLRESETDLRALQGVVAVAPNLDLERARRIVAEALPRARGAIHVVAAKGGGRVLDACDVALVKPGTITVESMLRRKPMVVVGRVHAATAIIARRALRVRWLSMPNLIAQREIVPEFFQQAATPERIAVALAPLFQEEGEVRRRQVAELDRASLLLGEPGAARRTALIAEEMLETHSA